MEIVGPEVDLVVKAANQQTPDVKIQAQSAWSIRDLKLHLAEIYPSKPNVDEQKIIYSGRLLADSTVLKDVLRQYEGQRDHTLHLVCARQRQHNTNTSEPNTSSETATNGDGLRRRNVAEPAGPDQPARPETAQNELNFNAGNPNYYAYFMSQYHRPQFNGPAFNQPQFNQSQFNQPQFNQPQFNRPALNQAQFNQPAFNQPQFNYQQMLMMQHAYAQYMHQYANSWQAAAGNPNAVQPANVPNEQEQQRPAAAAEANEDDGEGAAPRDWLDWVYALSRLAILFTLLYLYSTPLRLGLVMLLAAAYFFQLAAFREAPPRNPENAARRPQPEPPRADGPESAGTESQPQTAEVQQSVLGATWMIVTSFFTSLIPDVPNVV